MDPWGPTSSLLCQPPRWLGPSCRLSHGSSWCGHSSWLSAMITLTSYFSPAPRALAHQLSVLCSCTCCCPLLALPSVQSMTNTSTISASQSQAGAPLFSGMGVTEKGLLTQGAPRTEPLALPSGSQPCKTPRLLLVQSGQAEGLDFKAGTPPSTDWAHPIRPVASLPGRRGLPALQRLRENWQPLLHTVTSALLLVLRCRGPRTALP